VAGRDAVRDDGQQVRRVGSFALHPALPIGVAVGVVGVGFVAITVGRGWTVAAVWLPDLLVGLTLAGAGLMAWPRSRATGALLAVAGLTWVRGPPRRRRDVLASRAAGASAGELPGLAAAIPARRSGGARGLRRRARARCVG
jgi:hypothetical protein